MVLNLFKSATKPQNTKTPKPQNSENFIFNLFIFNV